MPTMESDDVRGKLSGELILRFCCSRPSERRTVSIANPSHQDALRHAFGLLARIELGRVPEWPGPDEDDKLRTRVELLAVLRNIVPRSQLARLAEVVRDWTARFKDKATARELREAAHAVLRDSRADFSSEDAAAEMGQVEAFLNVEIDRIADRVSSLAARQRAATALFTWRTQLRKEIEWTTLPGVVPGDRPVRIEDVYVDLYACPRDDHDATRGVELAGSSRARSRSRGDNASIGVASIVARTLDTCVVIGEPGSGKSTLIQWLAWATNNGRLHDFDFALVVKLRQYAADLADGSDVTIVEFFLESVIPRFGDWQDAAESLREAASRSRRVLLLLDGWDEVPAAQREQVRQRIQKECPYFVIVLTSRASGLPWQILPKGKGDYYEIAGLAPPAVRRFVEKQLLGTDDAAQGERVIAWIEAEPDLRAMAANPFILGLLVRVLSRPAHSEQRPTLAELFREITDWVVDHYRQTRAGAGQLVGEHLRAVESLSYSLVFGERSPRYVFRRQELDGVLASLDSQPLLDSRFVNRLDRGSDYWSFLHATLEEYFAACGLSAVSDEERIREWDCAVASQSRLVALQFFVGMQKSAAASIDRAGYWLRNPDRFGMILLRLARLAMAGQWERHFPDLTRELFERLWVQIITGADWRSARLFVEAFAELNPRELVHRASTESRVDGRVWEAIVDLVPLKLIKEGGLYDRLPKQMRDHLAVRTRDRPPPEQIDAVLRRLSDDGFPPEDLPRVLDEAALIPDEAVALQLLHRLRGAHDADLSTTLVMGLAPLFGLLPKSTVLELLLEEHDLPPTIRQLVSATLSHRQGRGQELDPDSRDRLLRRLAVLPPIDERIGPILDSLAGFPIRDGGRLIAELTSNRTLQPTVRISAIDVLETTSEVDAVRLAVAGVTSEPRGNVVQFLVELAAKRNVAVPLEWLEAEIDATSDPFNRRAFLLVTAYIRIVTGAASEPAQPVRTYLTVLLRSALTGTALEDDEQSWLLANALRSAEPRGNWLADLDMRALAQGVLRKFVEGEVVSLGQARLAASLLRGDVDEASILGMRRALDAIMRFLRKTSEKREIRQFESTAIEIAGDLAETALDQLLEYPPDCEPVREALGGLARDSGWMVFEDRILDADGNELADSKWARPSAVTLTPENGFSSLLETSPRARKMQF